MKLVEIESFEDLKVRPGQSSERRGGKQAKPSSYVDLRAKSKETNGKSYSDSPAKILAPVVISLGTF
jgi:hypothetical protein